MSGFEDPLDMKLRSDILGRLLLFSGYSLNDLDIRYLLYKLNKLWDGYANESIRPKSYIFMLSSNPLKNEVFRKRGSETICSDIKTRKGRLRIFCLRFIMRYMVSLKFNVSHKGAQAPLK